MNREYRVLKEYFDKYDEDAKHIIEDIKRSNDVVDNFIESTLKRLRSKEYDVICFMYYSICLIKQFGDDESLVISKDICDWFDNELQSGNRRVSINQEDKEDGSMKLSLRDMKDD